MGKLWEPPEKLGKTPRSCRGIDGSSYCTPHKLGCRTAKEEVVNGFLFITELADRIPRPIAFE
jgi:hypothetical protein